jgi:chaperonin cofactor prefoldin
MVTDSDVRLAIINAVLADVATKGDLEKLEAATKSDLENLRAELVKTEDRLRTEMENLRAEIKTEMGKLEERLERRISALESRVNSIEERLARLEGQMNLFVKLFIAFNLPILIAVRDSAEDGLRLSSDERTPERPTSGTHLSSLRVQVAHRFAANRLKKGEAWIRTVWVQRSLFPSMNSSII